MEQLNIETAIAESSAKLKVLKEYEKSEDGMNSYLRAGKHGQWRSCVKEEEQTGYQPIYPPAVESKSPSRPLKFTKPRVLSPEPTDHTGDQCYERNVDVLQMMQKQNMITELLVKQQSWAQLPEKDIPMFRGNPLAYRSFIRAIEHAIERRTDNEQDKLYYLQRYTVGEPHDLVRSCEHMAPDRGFKEAKRLLQKYYGDELNIASAYIDKALKWPQIKSDDGKALCAYALFLVGCHNTMEDVQFMEEMDNPTNMRIVISKLPYKMRERWRVEAYELKEKRGDRARFADLVVFIDRQAKVAADPLFGDSLDSRMAAKGKGKEREMPVKGRVKGSSFTTNLYVKKEVHDVLTKQTNVSKTANAFEKPCLFCQKNHALESCYKIKERAHKERVDFLKSKGLCFGCLTQGHLSRTCKRRMTCKECAQRHPDILHVEKEDYKDATMSTNQDSGNSQNEEVSCAQVSITQESCGHTGAEEIGCMLLIVPVKVKSRKSARCIETYAFMDPGSTATFCTEEIQKWLNVKGKPTQISLSTMSQGESGGPKLFNSYMLSDLEVCGLEDTKYIELPRVFTHKNIPVKKENIPREAYIHKWSYLRGVRLPHIDAEVGLLIGANSSKAMEPWHIINSLEDKQFMQSVQKTIKFVDGHYCIGLPLRHETPKVPNNRCMAEQGAASLLRKLKRNQEFLEDYKGFMKNMIKNGYAVAVPQERLKRDDGRVWYIPHHGVYHPRKKKIRVVFDCASSFQGVSLNGELLQGPDLTNTLIGALMTFLEEPVAIVADIESMFYQVKVPEGDTDLLRFLWWPDGNLNAHLEEFRMTVHIFGATSSPSCASYALRRTAEDRRSIAAPEAVETVLHNIYVDDCLKSVCSEEQAIALVKDLRDLCAQGGFCLTKWDELAKWAAEHHITHNAVNALLAVLGKHHPTLPRDARTLLESFDNVVSKWKKSCYTSDLNSDTEILGKRVSKRKVYSSSEEDESPPVEKKKFPLPQDPQPHHRLVDSLDLEHIMHCPAASSREQEQSKSGATNHQMFKV
ncbi:hypothetical protein SRHO_G00011330 [Serrasalmus rhombeus]